MADRVTVRIAATLSPSYAQRSAWSRLWQQLLSEYTAPPQAVEVTSPSPEEAISTKGEFHDKQIYDFPE